MVRYQFVVVYLNELLILGQEKKKKKVKNSLITKILQENIIERVKQEVKRAWIPVRI